MRLTNKKGLPKAIELAVSADPYSKGEADFTVTQLLKPGQIVALTAKHEAELEEDVADRIYSLTGQAMHAILERAAKAEPSLIIEQRFYLEILGKKIGGQIDMYDPATQTLIDWKQVSVWALKDGVKPEHEQQLNMNAALLRANGLPVKRVQIGAVYRDWSKKEALRSRQGDYPEKQAEIFTAPLWTQEQSISFITERVQHHLAALAGQVAPCADSDMWAKPPTYAVKEKGRKAALPGGLKETEQEAMIMVGSDPKRYIEYRPGERTRCEHYCPVNKFCKQYAAFKAANSKKESE